MPKRVRVLPPVDLGGLTLRGLRPGDEAELLEYRSLAEVAHHQYWEPDAPEAIQELVAQQSEPWPGVTGVPLVLAAEAEGKVVGNCTLVIADPVSRQGELGFTWHRGYAGRGLATRAVAGALGVAFQQAGLHKVTAAAFVENERAWRLLERVGMRREAHLIHDGWCKGRWVDVYGYGILEDEWRHSYPDLVHAVAPMARSQA